MGLFKIAVVSAIGVYSVRSVYRVNQFVKQVNVPRHSLLDKYSQKPNNKYKEYKDAYKIDLPPRFKLLKNTGSVNELYVHDFARNFFTCKIFCNIERPIIKLISRDYAADDTVLNYGAFKFQTKDKILLWRVISREKNEILMKWEFGGGSGTTWFCIPRDENCLLFGSSILIPKTNDGKEEVYHKESKQLFIDASRTLPASVPLGAKVKNFLIETFLSASIPIHQLYSKYLLLSTHNKIISDKDADRRKPVSYY